MVFIFKGYSRYFQIVGLVEVLYNTIMVLLNKFFTSTIRFHDVIHGFQAGCRTGTAYLKYNMLQHITAMREAVLHKIFLDLQKAYDALNRDRCLKIPTGYGLGHRSLRILWCTGYMLQCWRIPGAIMPPPSRDIME